MKYAIVGSRPVHLSIGNTCFLLVGYDDNQKCPDGSVGCWIILNMWGGIGNETLRLSYNRVAKAFQDNQAEAQVNC